MTNDPNEATGEAVSAISSRQLMFRIGVPAATTGVSRKTQTNESTMRVLIADHRTAHAVFDEMDAMYEDVDKAILASFEEAPLVLPCAGPTFSAVRAIGAERVIEQRNTSNKFGHQSALGPCRSEEVNRLRLFERQIREREYEFSWPGLTTAHEIAEQNEIAAWNALLDARPVTLSAASYRFQYIVKARPDGLYADELQRLADSFLGA